MASAGGYQSRHRPSLPPLNGLAPFYPFYDEFHDPTFGANNYNFGAGESGGGGFMTDNHRRYTNSGIPPAHNIVSHAPYGLAPLLQPGFAQGQEHGGRSSMLSAENLSYLNMLSLNPSLPMHSARRKLPAPFTFPQEFTNPFHQTNRPAVSSGMNDDAKLIESCPQHRQGALENPPPVVHGPEMPLHSLTPIPSVQRGPDLPSTTGEHVGAGDAFTTTGPNYPSSGSSVSPNSSAHTTVSPAGLDQHLFGPFSPVHSNMINTTLAPAPTPHYDTYDNKYDQSMTMSYEQRGPFTRETQDGVASSFVYNVEDTSSQSNWNTPRSSLYSGSTSDTSVSKPSPFYSSYTATQPTSQPMLTHNTAESGDSKSNEEVSQSVNVDEMMKDGSGHGQSGTSTSGTAHRMSLANINAPN